METCRAGTWVAVRVTDEGGIIVDDKYLHSYDFIAAQVRSVTDQPIRYDLNTHHHFDHAGSNADFMQNAEAIAHKNARANIVRNDQTGAPRLVFGDETAVFLVESKCRPATWAGAIRAATRSSTSRTWAPSTPSRTWAPSTPVTCSSGASCLRLVRALCAETHEGWLEDHRYLNMDYWKELKKDLEPVAA